MATSAPRHLSKASRALWRRTCQDFDLEPHDERTLQTALEAWDTMVNAQTIVATDGMVVEDRFGQKRAHPMMSVIRATAGLPSCAA